MTLQVSVRSNLYKDSVALMRIAEEVRAATGVARATLLMGTEANKAILEQAGLFSDALRAARAADLMVLVEDADDHDGSRVAAALQLAERLLAGKAAASQPGVQQMSPQSMAMAVAAANEAGNSQAWHRFRYPVRMRRPRRSRRSRPVWMYSCFRTMSRWNRSWPSSNWPRPMAGW